MCKDRTGLVTLHTCERVQCREIIKQSQQMSFKEHEATVSNTNCHKVAPVYYGLTHMGGPTGSLWTIYCI